jgi:RimJ/RimL family protein N-acetyltransferase
VLLNPSLELTFTDQRRPAQLKREVSRNMIVRTLKPPDAVSFVALRLEGLREFPEAFASSYEEEAATPLPEVEARLQPNADRAVIGAFEESFLLGVVGVQREALTKLSHKAFLWGMYVAPSARGRGVGAQVLRAALEYASASLGVRQVNLRANARNAPATALYKKLGFIEYGLERDSMLVGGEYHDEFEMVCKLHREA